MLIHGKTHDAVVADDASGGTWAWRVESMKGEASVRLTGRSAPYGGAVAGARDALSWCDAVADAVDDELSGEMEHVRGAVLARLHWWSCFVPLDDGVPDELLVRLSPELRSRARRVADEIARARLSRVQAPIIAQILPDIRVDWP